MVDPVPVFRFVKLGVRQKSVRPVPVVRCILNRYNEVLGEVGEKTGGSAEPPRRSRASVSTKP